MLNCLSALYLQPWPLSSGELMYPPAQPTPPSRSPYSTWSVPFISCGWRNKLPHTLWLRTTDFFKKNLAFFFLLLSCVNSLYILDACFVLSCFSHVRLFATLWIVTHQAPLSMGFSRQEHWSLLPRPPPGENEKFCLSQLWRPEIWSRGVHRAMLPLTALGENPSSPLLASGGG